LKEEGQIYKVVVNRTNAKKYPTMRKLFYDKDDPITDQWIIWFDDDSIANKDPQWLSRLCKAIIAAYPQGARIFGAEFNWTFSQHQVDWIKSRPWYKGRPLQMANGHPAPNGNKVVFPAGGFWSLETDAMRKAGVPDEQIGHNGGDYMIAEQLWQTGYRMKGWNNGKKWITTSSVKRRGITEHHTGTAGWVPGGNPK